MQRMILNKTSLIIKYSLFGKTMENVKKHPENRLASNYKRKHDLVSDQNYYAT